MPALTAAESSVLAAIDREWALQRLIDLLEVPSITGTSAESSAQHWLAAQFDELGLAVDLWQIDVAHARNQPDFPGLEAPREEAWGLVGTTGAGDGPTFVLNGHIDVVPPGDPSQWEIDPFRPRIDSDVIRGRGTCDMKAGLVAALIAAKAVRDSGARLAGTLALHSVVGEEDGGLGAWATLQRGYRGDAAVILEPTGGTVHTANAGALTFRIELTGRAAHGASRNLGRSAFELFWPVHLALRELEMERNINVDSRFGDNTLPYALSIGTVSAGDWASTVPDRLVAEGRYGVVIGEDAAAARSIFEQRVADACARDAWLLDHPAVISWPGGQFGSGSMPAGHPLLGLVQSAVADVGGGSAPEQAAPYGSDLRQYAAVAVPTVHYGPGDARHAHTADEQVTITDLMTVAHAVTLLAVRTCGIR